MTLSANPPRDAERPRDRAYRKAVPEAPEPRSEDPSALRLPALTPEQAREMYHLAEEEYHIPLALMLEHGGRSFLGLARRFMATPGTAVVLAGKGWNGADALAAARHLLNAGWQVRACLAVPPETLHAFSWLQVQMLSAHGVDVRDARGEDPFDGADVIVDGLLGTNARGTPRPPMTALIDAANASPARRISLDVPTGVDPATGTPTGPAFEAEATLMLGLPKAGSVSEATRPYAGTLHLADISLPAGLHRHFGATRPAFDGEGLLDLE